jgi:hypothetical protein
MELFLLSTPHRYPLRLPPVQDCLYVSLCALWTILCGIDPPVGLMLLGSANVGI